MGDFKGFGPQALAFFKALKFHQSKAWFDENRGLYESDVVEPMIALLDDLTATFAKRKIPLKADGKRSIFRIHRDVRFARDKSPYKTHAGAVMTRSGDKKEQGLLYVHIDPEGCFIAAGFYMPEAAELAALRRAVQTRPARAAAPAASRGRNRGGLGAVAPVSRVTRGFDDLKGGPLDGVIRLKSLIVEERVAEAAITSPGFAGTVLDFTRRAMPLLDFGWEALAPGA